MAITCEVPAEMRETLSLGDNSSFYLANGTVIGNLPFCVDTLPPLAGVNTLVQQQQVDDLDLRRVVRLALQVKKAGIRIAAPFDDTVGIFPKSGYAIIPDTNEPFTHRGIDVLVKTHTQATGEHGSFVGTMRPKPSRRNVRA